LTLGTTTWARSFTLALALTLAGCGEDTAPPATQENVDFDPRAPGAMPTHEISFQLLSKSNPARLEHIQFLFEQRGQRCGRVLSATLMGGMSGMDEWRVKCEDTGEWELWLKPVGHDVERVG
jgi:hypothetical protein